MTQPTLGRAVTAHDAPIRIGTKGYLDALTGVLFSAFLHGDLGDHLVPDFAERARVYWPYFQILADYALSAGHVELIAARPGLPARAAAIWFEVGDQLDLDIPDYDDRLARAVGDSLATFVTLDESMHAHHPAGRPHHYLAFLAVQPAYQGRGLGSRLLENRHQQLDAAGAAAYLEATGQRNADLYARHGYQLQTPFRVGGDGPPLYPMWRDPQRRRRRTRTGRARTALRAL